MGKRCFDICLASLGLILLFPLIVFISILIYVKLGWPVIFRQERPGIRGKSFLLYKFRSMTNEKDEFGKLLSNEKRLTNFGRKLRATSLDELPSLLNVLKGDMSLVGPRPLRMQYLEYFTVDQMRRHDVLPGITGYAQVNGRSNNTWDEKFALDIWYVDHQNILLDIKILFKTVINVLKKKDVIPNDRQFEIPFDEYIKEKLSHEKQG